MTTCRELGINATSVLQSDIRDTVAWLSNSIDSVWNGLSATYAVWRYFGTENGVFWLRHGSRTDHKYDHLQRAWYILLYPLSPIKRSYNPTIAC